MNNIFQYSNGWGHLIMSIVLIAVGCLFVLLPGTNGDIHGVGIMLVTTVSGAWFIPGAAKQVLSQVQNGNSNVPPVSLQQTPVPPIGGGN
jgi:uncharacterized membrane protein HdeD (DUF308 family)